MWVSCHIYYQQPIESVLIKIVKPLLDEFTDSALVSLFFFVRYADQYNHIRLRVKAASVEQVPVLKNDINLYLEKNNIFQFTLNLSERSDTAYFKFIDYEPEIQRYGGEKALIIAESQFELSSKTVLEILNISPIWSFQRSFITALYLNMAFTFVLYTNPKECIQFWNYNFKTWLHMGISDTCETEILLTNHYSNYFEINKKSICPIIEAVWNSLVEEVTFDEEWMNKWINGMKGIRKALEKVEINPMLLNSVYDSYLHMTYNRLGIQNKDESLISFLIYNTLIDMYEHA